MKLAKVDATPKAVIRTEIAWKAQSRLSARNRALIKSGKRPTIAVTAVARELCGFIWAIDRAMTGTDAAKGNR